MIIRLKNACALAMALLLVNPLCCCALGSECAPDQQPARSCCSSSADTQADQQNQNNTHTCLCSQQEEYTDSKPYHFQATAFTLAPNPPIPSWAIINRPNANPMLAARSVHPPPPGSSLSILYSVFRL